MTDFTQQTDSVSRTETAYQFAQKTADRAAASKLAPLVLLIDADRDARFMMRTLLEM